MVCERCGTEVHAEAAFCNSCGRGLGEDAADRAGGWPVVAGARRGRYSSGAEPDNGCSIAGMVCSGLAFVTALAVFGIVGVVLSGFAIARNERLASLAMVVSFMGLVVGIVLAAMRVTGFVPSL